MSDSIKGELTKDVRFYFSVTAIPVGIILNGVALSVFVTKKLNNKNIFGYLYSWLCVTNIICLTNELIFSLFGHFDVEAFSVSDFTCRTVFGWVKYVTHIPSFIMILVAFYLYVTICHPNKKEYIHKKKLIMILITILFVTIIDCFYFIYSKVEIERNTIQIGLNETIEEIVYDCSVNMIIDLGADVVHMFMRSVIPFIFIMILNYLTIRGVMKAKKAIKVKTQEQNGKKSAGSKDKFANSIIGMNFIFIGIYTPWAILYMTFHLNHTFHLFPALIESAGFDVSLGLFECFAYLNNMAPFVLSLIFNTVFRNQFMHMYGINNILYGKLSKNGSVMSKILNTNISTIG
jgi:hypothetical protein